MARILRPLLGEWLSSYDVETSSHLCWWILPSPPSNKNYKKTHSYTAGHPYPYNISPHAGILKNTYVLFPGKYYEQVHGTAMGSAISPILANLFMDEFESKAIGTAPSQPRPLLRYVDDTFVIQNTASSSYTTSTPLTHIYSLPQRFPTAIDPFHFLCTLISPGSDSMLLASVYRKPTHTDHYIHWDNPHNLSETYT